MSYTATAGSVVHMAMFVLYIDQELFFWLKNRPRQKVHQWLAIVRYNGMCNVPRRQMHKASSSTNVQIHKHSNSQIHKSKMGKHTNMSNETLDECRTEHAQAQTRSSKKSSTGDQTLILDL